MKILILLMVSFSVIAEVNGDLDKSFGSDPDQDDHWFGWVGFNSSGRESYKYNSVLDSQGRVITLGVYRPAGSNNDFQIELDRYSATGEIDITFIGEAGIIDKSLINEDYVMGIELDENDGVFLAYTILTCQAGNTSCQQDIRIAHYDNTGAETASSRVISFDIGSMFLRQDDVFSDLVYIKELKKLVIVAEVEQNSINDTDFGIAVMDVNINGAFIFSDFSFDALETCFFDQDGSGGSVDKAISVVYHPDPPYKVIVGGSAFEGNGSNSDGWNLAFCEYDVNGSGALLNKWSSITFEDVLDDRELLQDMVFLPLAATPTLMVTAQVPNGNDMDFALLKYEWDTLGNNWKLDNSYGPNEIGQRLGISTIGFNQLFIGDTNDISKQIVVESDGSVIVVGNSIWTDNAIQHSQIKLVKFNQVGLIDASWGNLGQVSHQLSSINDQVNAMIKDESKKELYMVGSHIIDGNKGDFLANILNNPDVIFKNGLEQTRTL